MSEKEKNRTKPLYCDDKNALNIDKFCILSYS